MFLFFVEWDLQTETVFLVGGRALAKATICTFYPSTGGPPNAIVTET